MYFQPLVSTAKSTGSLPLMVFRRYYSELRQALGSELCSGTPVANQENGPRTLPQVTADDHRSPVEGAETLLLSTERRLTTENSWKPLVELCDLLEARRGAAGLVASIKDQIG